VKTKTVFKIWLFAAAVALCLSGPALADGQDQWEDVDTGWANPSPSPGSSNLNNYKYQDEQININGNRDAVVKVLRVDQKHLVNDFVARTFPIRNASPIELRRAFRMVVQAEGGSAEIIQDQQRGEFFLYVLAPTFQMPHIERALRELDQAWVQDNVDGSVDQYFKPKFRDAEAVGDLAEVPGSASIGYRGDNIYTVDEVANAAHVSGEPYRVAEFMKYARQIDQPIPQALIEIAVYEVDVSNHKKLGLDYIAWKNGPGQNLFRFVWWGTDFQQRFWDYSSIFDPYLGCGTAEYEAGSATNQGHSRGMYSSFNYLLSAEYLDFLEGSGRAQVVGRGKLLIKNGEEGAFAALDQELFFTTSTASSGSWYCPRGDYEEGDEYYYEYWYNRKVRKDQREVIGFEMSVTPYIGEKTTELVIEYDYGGDAEFEAENIVGLQPGGALLIRCHELYTTVLVQDGQPLCIGGLKRTEDVRQTQKMPFLGDLPVIGWLFGREQDLKRETETVIVITPKIRLGTEADFEMASEEDNVVRAQVDNEMDLFLPRTEFGFDQWLLDETRTEPW